jgi:hypothetical protein
MPIIWGLGNKSPVNPYDENELGVPAVSYTQIEYQALLAVYTVKMKTE